MRDDGGATFFWISRVGLTGLSAFFVFMGVDLLRSAYRLENPGWFIMTFFAANLIILIAATLGLGFTLSMIRRVKSEPHHRGRRGMPPPREGKPDPDPGPDEAAAENSDGD